MSLHHAKECRHCPRLCGADRRKEASGFCRTDTGLAIASICIHRGEEPAIGGKQGICNIFFAHCNLQCRYCQNFQISRNASSLSSAYQALPVVVERIIHILEQGIEAIGFVSPSHMIPQMSLIIEALHQRNHFPTVVFNTNSYDRAENLQQLAPLIDVYLADFKYADPTLARELSAAPDYPQVALQAIAEMVAQKGYHLTLDGEGQATAGLIVRHLILPGYAENSIEALRTLAGRFSTKIHVSLMAQYHPTPFTKEHATLNRTLSQPEYDRVVDELTDLGFENGWIQELDSATAYRPDFQQSHPFEY